jgi:hypothetical protein
MAGWHAQEQKDDVFGMPMPHSKAALLQNFMEEQLCSIVSEAFRYKIIFTSRNEVF